MMGRLSQAWNIYRREGLVSLCERTSRFTRAKLGKARDSVVATYWNKRGGTQSFTVEGVTATFDAKSSRGGDRTRWRIRHEETMLSDFVRTVEEGDTIFDVGANVGLYSCFAGQKVKDGEVIAFEPYPPNVEQLERNVNYCRGDIETHRIALSNRNGEIEFDYPAERDVGLGSISVSQTQSGDSVAVKTTPGDLLVTEGFVPQPNVVKIDVEGSEPLVLDGLKETLSSDDCRALYCEMHLPANGRASVEDYDTTVDELTNRILDWGFCVEIQEQRGTEVHLKFVKP